MPAVLLPVGVALPVSPVEDKHDPYNCSLCMLPSYALAKILRDMKHQVSPAKEIHVS